MPPQRAHEKFVLRRMSQRDKAEQNFCSALYFPSSLGSVPQSEGNSNRSAPEPEVLEIEVNFVIVAALQSAEVAHVAAQPDVVGEEHMHAAADVHAQLAAAEIVEQARRADVGAQQT